MPTARDGSKNHSANPQSNDSAEGSVTTAQPERVASPGLTVAAVAKRLGVAPATLRTWDRRYGVGPSAHSAGSHRRYSEQDIARLVVMRKLALDGVAPVDAAKAALLADLSNVSSESVAQDLRELRAASLQQSQVDEWVDPEPSAPVESVVGIHKIEPSPDVDPPRARILHLAATPEHTTWTSSDIIDEVLQRQSAEVARMLELKADTDIEDWWNNLVVPSVERLASRTVLAAPGEAPVLMLQQEAMTAISRYVGSLDEHAALQGRARLHPSRNRNMVLVFTLAHDSSPLLSHAIAAALTGREVTVRLVSGPVDSHRTLEIVTMVKPAAVVLVSSQARSPLDLVGTINDANPSLPLFVSVPDDETAAELPASAAITRVRSFTGLLHEVLAVVSPKTM